MKKILDERGFTLIEMLIVLLVISILLIITIPNITKHQSTIHSKGCEAFIKMAQAQVQAYEIDNAKLPMSINELENQGYLKQTTCPNGEEISMDKKGKITIVE
ncbi:competence type IV pilus major pilin ComGC [Peribacillus sp. SI8-4]|uniref:competence type IV pilus major pilin ComGC n=1 Tax=Peribacillus sp. SI8-4 TaxID=3048009 RepID=UPI0025535649|nr:competence type IV pilus major pilin ComGC [Peribacillus sp. SI8-4]